MGWDGSHYALWSTQSTYQIIKNGIDLYFIQRILPSTIIHYTSTLIKYPLHSTDRIIHAFYIYNFIMITLGGITLWRISKHLKWNSKIFYLAFAGIFFYEFRTLDVK